MKKIIHIAFLFLAINIEAQPPSRWYNKFGGGGIDIGYGVKETFDRQYVVVGSTSSFGSGTTDAYLILVDSMGQKIWEKNYGGALTDVAKALVINPVDSGFIFAGYSNSIGFGGYDVYVVRTDKNGNIIWQKSFGDIDWEFANDIELAPDGNVVICGYTYSKGYGKRDAYLLKINSANGALIWEKNYGGSEDDEFRSIALMPDNNYVLTGKTCSYQDIKGDVYFLKIDPNGDSLVAKTLGLKNKEDIGNSIIEGILGGYIIGGSTESYSSFGKDAFISKVSNSGDSIWLEHYGNANYDQEAVKVIRTFNLQGAYIISYSDVEPSFKRNPKNLILSGNGIYMSGHDFGDYEDDELNDLGNTIDKGFIGVGYTKSWGSQNEDLLIVKYDSIAHEAGNLIGLNDQQLISKIINVYPSIISNESPVLHIDSQKKFELIICDIFSKKIIMENLPPEKTASINLRSLSAGIFFVKITQENKTVVFKIIKQD